MPKPTLEDAIALAAQLHKGQVDKAGMPYILHPLRVMLNPILKTEEERMAAVLHDVMEDCGMTKERLRELGYSDEVITIIVAVSKLPGEENDYEAFIVRIYLTESVSIIRVKLSDLGDNSDLTRIPNPTKEDIARVEKYRRAIDLLTVAPCLH